MEHPSDSHKGRRNQHKNSSSLYNAKEHPLLIFKERHSKLRQQND